MVKKNDYAILIHISTHSTEIRPIVLMDTILENCVENRHSSASVSNSQQVAAQEDSNMRNIENISTDLTQSSRQPPVYNRFDFSGKRKGEGNIHCLTDCKRRKI